MASSHGVAITFWAPDPSGAKCAHRPTRRRGPKSVALTTKSMRGLMNYPKRRVQYVARLLTCWMRGQRCHCIPRLGSLPNAGTVRTGQDHATRSTTNHKTTHIIANDQRPIRLRPDCGTRSTRVRHGVVIESAKQCDSTPLMPATRSCCHIYTTHTASTDAGDTPRGEGRASGLTVRHAPHAYGISRPIKQYPGTSACPGGTEG